MDVSFAKANIMEVYVFCLRKSAIAFQGQFSAITKFEIRSRKKDDPSKVANDFFFNNVGVQRERARETDTLTQCSPRSVRHKGINFPYPQRG